MTHEVLDTPIRTKRPYTRRARPAMNGPDDEEWQAEQAVADLADRITALETALADLQDFAIKAREPSATGRWAWERRKARLKAERDLP